MRAPVSEPDLMPTEVGEDVRTTLRDLLARRCDPAAVVACYDGDRSLVAPLWRAISRDLGLAGLLVDEAYGGAGATTREAAVVLAELGVAVAPVPFLTSAVVATTVLNRGAAAGNGAAGELLGRLASGGATAGLLVPFSTGPAASVRPVPTGTEGSLRGTVTSVAGALDAEVLLVPVRTDAGLEVHAVPVGPGSTTLTAVVSLDMTRQLADVTLHDAAGTMVVPAAVGTTALREALLAGAALLASEQAGLARWCLTTTVAYLKERRQFGRPVGGFQALKHRLADLYVDVESADAAATYAAAVIAETDTGPDPRNPRTPAAETAIATAVAQSWCSEVAVRAAEEAVQLHGGIGMTWEHPAHLYLKRAKADQLGLGSPEEHRSVLAGLVDLPAR